MPTQPFPEFPIQVDSTMLSTLQCEQKFFDQFVLNISPQAVSPDLHAGGAFAAGLEAARREYYLNERTPQQAIPIILHSFMIYWGLYDPHDKKGEPHVKDFVNTFCALLDYFREYPIETDELEPLMLANGAPAIEFTFALPLEVLHPVTDEPILYCGRCDMVGYYQGLLRVVDEKTGKSLSDAAKWNMRGQFIGYVWAARQHGWPVEGALVRNIAILKTQYDHLQAPIHYPNYLIDRWYEATCEKLHNAIRKWEHMIAKPERWHEPWRKEFGEACEAYGSCQYMGLCRAKEPWKWYNDFEIRKWNPLEKDPTTGNVSKYEELEDVFLPAEARHG